MSTLISKPLKALALKAFIGNLLINTYHLKVYTFEIKPRKLASTKLDIKSRNVKKYRKWEW